MVTGQIKFLSRLVSGIFLGFIILSGTILIQGTITPAVSAGSLLSVNPPAGQRYDFQALEPSFGLASPNSLLTSTLYLPLVLNSSEGVPDNGLDCNPSGGSGGLAAGTVAEVTVGGLLSSVVVGDGYDPAKPTYLVFYLHGDEGNYSQFQINGHKVSTLIKEKGWVFVAPRSHLSSSGKYSWWQSPNKNIPALTAVFEEMFAKYNLCRDAILAGTLSGGSTFYTANFFPEKGGEYPTHLILFCGGVQPSSVGRGKVTTLGQDPDIVDRSSFKFRYGTEDFLYDDIQKTISFYSDAGFTVTQQKEAGVGHCVSNASQKMRDFLVDKAAELGID